MFSSNELVQLVFANEDDVYYCEDLTRPDLRRYLWRQLHAQERCSAVYFLRADEKGKRFTVRSFGDRKAQDYVPKKSLFGKSNEQAGWIRTQLQRAAVFVCPLEDFCRVAESGDWEKGLREIAEARDRRGFFVLTAPPEAERSAPQLLASPVFDWLGDSAVTDARRGEPQALYGAIRRRKGSEACVFLNEFREETLRGLLVQAAFDGKQRFASRGELDAAAAALAAYLGSERAQRARPLFEHTDPAAYLRYRDLFEKLTQDAVWERLMERAAGEERSPEHAPGDAPVRRSRKSGAGRCIPRLFAEQSRLCADPETEELYDGALRALMTPDNRPENPAVAKALDTLSALAGAAGAQSPECARRILRAVAWCARRLGTDRESAAERAQELAKYTASYADACAQRLRMERALERSAQTLTESERYLLSGQAETLGEMCREYARVLDSLCSDVHELIRTDALDRRLRELEEIRDRLGDTQQPQPEPEPEPAPEPLEEDDDLEWMYKTEKHFGEKYKI